MEKRDIVRAVVLLDVFVEVEVQEVLVLLDLLRKDLNIFSLLRHSLLLLLQHEQNLLTLSQQIVHQILPVIM